jgi:glycosyltransferase involved in cell wall biosynthesis
MKILALEPYHGGSHKAFLDGWCSVSRHQWTTLGLPAHQWKWRMRHAAVTLAEQVDRLAAEGGAWDLLFCSDMLNLAEFRGLVTGDVGSLPAVAYFHENQLTYPVRHEDERDLHFAYTNFTTALTATEVWFNSAFHRDSFLEALAVFLGCMPDYSSIGRVEDIRSKSYIHPQGIQRIPPRRDRLPGSPVVLWAARWEHDKNPELFFAALDVLQGQGLDFRASVIGEQFSDVPEVFGEARRNLGQRVVRWGYQDSREEYVRALLEADIVVSTANHEFFGVSMVEAIAAGAFPLLPDRLAYPELIKAGGAVRPEEFLYDGSQSDLVQKLGALITSAAEGTLWRGDSVRIHQAVERFYWDNLAPELDTALERVVSRSRS